MSIDSEVDRIIMRKIERGSGETMNIEKHTARVQQETCAAHAQVMNIRKRLNPADPTALSDDPELTAAIVHLEQKQKELLQCDRLYLMNRIEELENEVATLRGGAK